MSWSKQIDHWLKDKKSREEVFIGERTQKWIESFREDLRRWGYPAELIIINPVLIKGKATVALRKYHGI